MICKVIGSIKQRYRITDMRPGYYSGLLVIVMLCCVHGTEHAPFNLLLEDVVCPVTLKNAVFSLRPSDTSCVRRIFSSFDYDDYYHAKKTDNAQTPSIRINQIAESPRFTGNILIKRPSWAISPSLNIRKAFVRDYSAHSSYQSQSSMSLEKAGISGWFSFGSIMAAGYVGGNIDNELCSHSVQCDYAAMAGVSKGDLFLAVYGASELLPLTNFTVTNTGDSAHVSASARAVYQTLGITAHLQKPSLTLEFNGAYAVLRSDTQTIASTEVPVTLRAGAVHASAYAQLNMLPCKPSVKINAGLAQPVVRSYDGKGGPEYFYLNDNTSVFGSAELSGSVPLAIEAGMTAEYFSFNTNAAGRLDPYMFSSMTFFVPTKYKIDSLLLNYSSIGFFAQRRQPVFNFWQLQEMLSVSRIVITSSTHTREFDFSYIIPRLINPRTSTIIDEDVLLFVVGLNNSIHVSSKTTITAGIQQALPVTLTHKSSVSSSGQSSGGSNTGFLSVRGGTRYSAGIVSLF
jgi:hypothetical protein